MKRAGWPFLGLGLGAIAGALWGWFGGSGYEAIDSAVGTGFLCALAGLLIGTVADTVTRRHDRKGP